MSTVVITQADPEDIGTSAGPKHLSAALNNSSVHSQCQRFPSNAVTLYNPTDTAQCPGLWIKKDLLYREGKRWNFVDRDHSNYVEPMHRDFEQELLANGSRDALCTLDVTGMWATLEQRVEKLMKQPAAQRLSSNGKHGISKGQPIDKEHLMALLIHTDLTDVDREYSNILRRGDREEISCIAHWARLLMETVQCFGSRVTEKEVFHPEVDRTCLFQTVPMRFNAFNLPMSPSTKRETAFDFADSNGITLTLQYVDDRYSATTPTKFDRSTFPVIPSLDSLCLDVDEQTDRLVIRHRDQRMGRIPKQIPSGGMIKMSTDPVLDSFECNLDDPGTVDLDKGHEPLTNEMDYDKSLCAMTGTSVSSENVVKSDEINATTVILQSLAFVSIFSFGISWIPEVLPLFANLKEEMLRNPIYSISVKAWNGTVKKCHKMLKGEYSSFERKVWFRKMRENKIRVRHLIALKLYTDFDVLQREFRKSFRAPFNEMQRFRAFYHWRRLLKETFCRFSAVIRECDQPQILFHGVNAIMPIDKFSGINFGPSSTTTDLHVARSFAGKHGMILVLVPERSLSKTAYRVLDISWVSDYPDEKEYLIFDHEIKVQSWILSSDYDRHYRYYHDVLGHNIQSRDTIPYGHLSYSDQMEVTNLFADLSSLIDQKVDGSQIDDFEQRRVCLVDQIHDFMDDGDRKISKDFQQSVMDNLKYVSMKAAARCG